MSTSRFGEPDWPRFFKYIEKREDGCWQWIGARRGNGRNEYGAFWANGTQRAHIVSYVWTYGEPNADLHHTCDNPLCVNPEHLTPAASGQRRHRNVVRDLCAKGHPFDGMNSRGERTCSICDKETNRRWREENRDKINARKRELRRQKGELVQHEPRPCKICGKIFTPQRVGSGRGELCPEPDPGNEQEHRAWRDCVNERQRQNRINRLSQGEDE